MTIKNTAHKSRKKDIARRALKRELTNTYERLIRERKNPLDYQKRDRIQELGRILKVL